MIVIEVKFTEVGKSYEYLLINPNNYKINPAKVLRYVSGSSYNKPIYKTLLPIKSYKTDTLPSIVTSQIILLDEDNNIEIQAIGNVSKTIPYKKDDKKTKETTTSQGMCRTAALDILEAEAKARIKTFFRRHNNKYLKEGL